jgi:hypothetical protein
VISFCGLVCTDQGRGIQRLGDAPTAVGADYKPRADGSTMKALAWFGARDVRLIDAPIPDITEPDDVILKVTGTTICGSDLHLCASFLSSSHPTNAFKVSRRDNPAARGRYPRA